jgi:hypothetical protein
MLRTLASCAFHTAAGRRVTMSHTTTHPSASLFSLVWAVELGFEGAWVPAAEARVVSEEVEGSDFHDMAP